MLAASEEEAAVQAAEAAARFLLAVGTVVEAGAQAAGGEAAKVWAAATGA